MDVRRGGGGTRAQDMVAASERWPAKKFVQKETSEQIYVKEEKYRHPRAIVRGGPASIRLQVITQAGRQRARVLAAVWCGALCRGG